MPCLKDLFLSSSISYKIDTTITNFEYSNLEHFMYNVNTFKEPKELKEYLDSIMNYIENRTKN